MGLAATMSEVLQIATPLLQIASLLVTTLLALWLSRQAQIVRGYLADVKEAVCDAKRLCAQIRRELEDMQPKPTDVEQILPFLNDDEKARMNEMIRLLLVGK